MACVDFLQVPGACKAVFGALKFAVESGEAMSLTMASHMIRVLSKSPRFIQNMYLSDVMGLMTIIRALSSSSGAMAASAVEWDTTTATSYITVTDDKVSSNSSGWVRAKTGYSTGRQVWYLTITKDSMSDEVHPRALNPVRRSLVFYAGLSCSARRSAFAPGHPAQAMIPPAGGRTVRTTVL